MHKIGLLPLGIDIVFISLNIMVVVLERNALYVESNTDFDKFYSCNTLYLSAFVIIICFIIDAIVYAIALIIKEVWKEYQRRLIFWLMFFLITYRLFTIIWLAEMLFYIKIGRCRDCM